LPLSVAVSASVFYAKCDPARKRLRIDGAGSAFFSCITHIDRFKSGGWNAPSAFSDFSLSNDSKDCRRGVGSGEESGAKCIPYAERTECGRASKTGNHAASSLKAGFHPSKIRGEYFFCHTFRWGRGGRRGACSEEGETDCHRGILSKKGEAG
ncbi:MAG: hypothetical protein ACFN2Z_02600, partial [Oribacterium sp.]